VDELLKRLSAELDRASDPDSRIELLSRIAISNARLKRFSESREAIAKARAVCGPDGRLGTLWIMLAEGVVGFFEEQSPHAMSRIQAAVVLGASMKYSRFVALGAAWKAHLECDAFKFSDMSKSLALAIDHLGETDLDAYTRIAIEIASGYAIAGRREKAKHWFTVGHRAASANGDRASIEALLYNKVALSIASMRVEGCSSSLSMELLGEVSRELRSLLNFNSLTGGFALMNHLQLVDARLRILLRDYREAKEKLQAIRGAKPFAENHFDPQYFALEVCFCSFHLGDSDAVNQYLNSVSQSDFQSLDLDDRIVASWMLATLSEADARFGNASAHRKALADQAEQYKAMQDSLAQSLDSLPTLP
jgi:hypothetical protein